MNVFALEDREGECENSSIGHRKSLSHKSNLQADGQADRYLLLQ